MSNQNSALILALAAIAGSQYETTLARYNFQGSKKGEYSPAKHPKASPAMQQREAKKRKRSKTGHKGH